MRVRSWERGAESTTATSSGSNNNSTATMEAMSPQDEGRIKMQEKETLRHVIAQWNANRLDLFELSEPNEDLEFHGVMRFYFQDAGQKVATKCIRVASTASTPLVIQTLIEKFRPDMRMLSIPEYALYEIHENGDERQLEVEEKPLLVQLNWHKDDREGRFLLRRINEKSNMPEMNFQEPASFRRKLSRREKKQQKKQEKLNRQKEAVENDSVAEKLYNELPETSFTRSISNPEAVMRRRRQQKLEKKLQQFRSKDGGPDTGGTLKIFGESLCRDVPYKTLLLSVRDSAAYIVKEMLDKYGLDREDPANYCLVQVTVSSPNGTPPPSGEYPSNSPNEYILDDDDCPLAILMTHAPSRGSIMFHVRRRPADFHSRKRKKKPQTKAKNELDHSYRYDDFVDKQPFLLELNPDGSDIVASTPKKHRLLPNVTEVGSERSVHQQTGGQSLQLFGPNIQPRHCVIAHTENITTVTPCSRDAETYVNGQRIYETTILQHSAIVRFGRIHYFRFWDPIQSERARHLHDSSGRPPIHHEYYDRQGTQGEAGNDPSGFETTFDVDGNVETVSTASLNKEDSQSQRSGASSTGRAGNYERVPRGQDPILPSSLEFREEAEEPFFHAIVSDLDTTNVQFKLAPTYSLYMAARYRATTHYQPELTPNERAQKLSATLARVADIIQHVVQKRYGDPNSLAFWMANSSELLHFLKSDRQICPFSVDAQDILAEAVQVAFRNLVSCLQGDLNTVMHHFLVDREDTAEEEGTTAPVLSVLQSAMALLRRCRVNAALTIQLFSQLFHFINMWVFNRVVSEIKPNLCTRLWGIRLKRRLARIELWAEKQGLELAADCHLSRIVQAAHLLQAPKSNADDIASLSSSCYKLNSLQLRALLQRYQPAPEEPRIPMDLVENVVRVAENTADELARSDGREVRLEEDPTLQLPFLLPEDGYSCEIVRGVPSGLCEFLAPLQHAGLCRMTANPTSCGYWTIYMGDPPSMLRSPSAMSSRSGADRSMQRQEPEIQVMRLQKSNNGLGLSIVAAKGAGQDRLGIYIKSVVKGGAADADGRLQAGDQLLKVDGQSLVAMTQEKAAEYLMRTGPIVTLEVAKQGAIYHGLATLLQQPSPVPGRASALQQQRSGERDLMPKQDELGPLHGSRIQSSKSVPSLNSGDGMHHPPAGPMKHHEVYNPGYSRTSSTNSIPQKTFEGQPVQQPANSAIRSRSIQSLNDPRGYPIAQHQQQGLLTSRHPSNPSLSQAPVGNKEERFYQNVAVFRDQNQNGYPPPSPSSGSMSSAQMHDDRLLQQQRSLRGSHSSLQRPPDMSLAAGLRERPASSYIPNQGPHPNHQDAQDHHSPGHMQQNNQIHHRGQPPHMHLPHQQYPHPQSPQRNFLRQEAKMQEMQEELRRREERGMQQRNMPPHGTYPGQVQHMKGPQGQPPRGALSVGHPQLHPHVQDSSGYPPQYYANQAQPNMPQNYNASPRYPQTNTGYVSMAPSAYPPSPRHAPPTAPKPRGEVVGRPPVPNDTNYHDTQAPPVPPSATHPLYQSKGSPQHMQPTEHNRDRYTASSGELPRGGYIPPNSVQVGPRSFQFNATNPWEREEKEKKLVWEKQLRQEAARQWRDQQISDLEDKEFRSPKEEEQLRTLRLEKEFQRRAEEMSKGDDDEEAEDDDDTVDRRGLLRMVQEDLERCRQRRLEKEAGMSRSNPNLSSGTNENLDGLNGVRPPLHQLQQQTNGQWTRGQDGPTPQHVPVNGQLPPQPHTQQQHASPPGRSDDDRSTKWGEMKRKQQELEAAREVEERILREAQRRRDEDIRMQQQRLQHLTLNNASSSPTRTSGHSRLDNLVANGISQTNGPSNYQPTAAPTTNNQMSHTNSSQRLELLLNSTTAPNQHNHQSPLTPPSNSGYLSPLASQTSYAATFHNMSWKDSNSAPQSNSGSSMKTQSSAPKRVSFHDSKVVNDSPPSSSPPAIEEEEREDPNSFINEAETLLASPRSPDANTGSTPGVIGAQEVYRDPRLRRLQEQQQKLLATRSPGPEKLSFREKMKMFAMETGEAETPKDKMKISKAQREIETGGPPRTDEVA